VQNKAIARIELAGQIEDMGLIVQTACDAHQAIALLDSHSEIRLLFTDIRMPGSMDGIRLAHHVRNRWPPVKIATMASMRLSATLGGRAAMTGPSKAP
jgi:CheY-like chemotaxis protein